MDLKNVKGIVITPEGDCHSFGKQKYATVEELGDENYHDTAFAAEIAKSDWFQSFIKMSNSNYTGDNIYRESMALAGLGLVFLFNASSLTARNTEYHSYFIQCPNEPTENQKNVLQDNYEQLAGLVESESAYFEGTAFTEEGDYAWQDFVVDIDSFYEKLEIPKTKGKAR